ncbi:MAG TPA: hypothetical protein VFT22_26570 [Kofleriaceae bacterium]|nr:hypothetical protein [Kofleriaceae bacterium]
MRTVLHLVRAGAAPSMVAERDWVVYLQPMTLVAGGTPHTAPFAPGSLDHDQLVTLTFAADLVITW